MFSESGISFEQWKKTGCLEYTGDYTTLTTQLYRDCHKPLKGSLLTDQYNGKYEGFFRGSFGIPSCCFAVRWFAKAKVSATNDIKTLWCIDSGTISSTSTTTVTQTSSTATSTSKTRTATSSTTYTRKVGLSRLEWSRCRWNHEKDSRWSKKCMWNIAEQDCQVFFLKEHFYFQHLHIYHKYQCVDERQQQHYEQ